MGAKKSKQKVVTLTFSKTRLQEMQDAFNLFDENRDGHISVKELQTIMRKLNQPMQQSDLLEMISEVDIDNDGVIDFGEFLIMMKRIDMVANREEEIRQMYEVFDIRKTGRVTAEDLKIVMNRIGEKTTDSDIAEMMEEADINKDGFITFSEFRSLCDRLQLV
ncbi:neo-calmodulin-like [Diorhabda carinulata]|uniref:neo-calmodulin-like n=1 Tax=Diorhabda carinulata TaxID=1163345 RepID=UPI0025A23897|nr:neo-calmodulin-like [Diorhabda carinulata]